VDCTWDDPIGVHEGYVGHDNFLRSQEGMIITGHHNNGKIDYKPSFSMDNTKYDNYYWQKSLTEFQLVDNKLYYVDCESYTLKSAGNDKILCSVYDDWVIDDYYYYYCPTLVSDDTDLFFSLSKYVCKYDINSGKSNIIYSPELSKDKSIYGLKNKDNVFYCTVSDAPYNASETDVVSFTYNPSDAKKCKIDVYSNDYFASFTGSGVYNENATVTIKISSDCGYDFIGYYINGVKVSSNRTYTFKATKNELIEARYDICEHNYVKTKSQSDYNDYCYSQYTCTNCGENYYQYNSESHCWGSKTVKAPTSTKVGYTQYTCAECGNYCRTSIKSPTGKTSSLKASKKTSSSQTVTWSKVSGASGYQVQISKKNSSQWSSSVTVKSNSYAFKNLTSGSNYKFRVRFYVTYNGKKYYSNWSSVLTSPTLPPSASISKLSSLKKSFKASWKKKSVSGYQIQYSTSSSFKSGVKTVNINKSSTVSKTVKGLKSKKKYYVRIRTYKTISGKKVYSAWSAKKSVTVK
ncbi:MAG: fibronectin type III domain-containing protein, partial [Eubacterium sp.]